MKALAATQVELVRIQHYKLKDVTVPKLKMKLLKLYLELRNRITKRMLKSKAHLTSIVIFLRT